MAYSEKLADRIRKALAHLHNVEEKKMFGSLAFMINGKMCLTAGPGRMMCRIDPGLYEDAVQRTGCKQVIMRGRKYKGFVYVSEEALKSKADFEYWVGLALEFNEKAYSSRQ